MTSALLTAPPEAKVKIDGANYRAVDTGDGYFTVKEVPIFSEVKKGTKGAPEDVTKDWLEGAVRIAQEQYQRDKFAGPCHIGHNKGVLELNDPEFAGFFLPKRVGIYAVGGDAKYTIYADLKLKASAFERAKRGELPYISVEVNDWATGKIDSLSFLNSKVPYFQYSLFTIGDIVTDHAAKFEVSTAKPAKFQFPDKDKEKEEGEEKEEGGEKKPFEADKEGEDKGEGEGVTEEKNQQVFDPNAGMRILMDKVYALESLAIKMAQMMGIPYGGKMEDTNMKPDASPVEQDAMKKKETAMMKQDAESAAKFAAYEDRIKVLEGEAAARKAEEGAKVLEAGALESLKGYTLGENTRQGIAKFARMGKDQLDAFVATVKEVGMKAPPSTLAEYEQSSVELSEPALAKFQQDGPDKLEQAAKFLAQYKEMKRLKMPINASAEEYIAAQFKASNFGKGGK